MGLKLSWGISVTGRQSRDLVQISTLVGGNRAYNSDEIEAIIVEATEELSELAPTPVQFMTWKAEALDANGKVVRGKYQSGELEIAGKFAIPAGDRMAHEQITVLIKKKSNALRKGVFILRHFATSQEFAAWQEEGTKPARFTSVTDGMTHLQKFADILATGGMALALPDAAGDGVIGLRPVNSLTWSGIDIVKKRKRKTGTRRKMVNSAQQQISDLGRDARFKLYTPDGSAPSFQQRMLAYALNVEAANIYDAQDADIKARIKWPDVFYYPAPDLPLGNALYIPVT